MKELISIVVFLGVAVAAGVIVFAVADKVTTVSGTPTNVNIGYAVTNLTSSAATGMSFLPILVLAAVGAVAIGYIWMLVPKQGI